MLWHAMWIGVESFAICLRNPLRVSPYRIGEKAAGGGVGRGGKEIKVGQEKEKVERGG